MKTPLSPTHLFENGRLCFPYGACVEMKELHPAEVAPLLQPPAAHTADMQPQQQQPHQPQVEKKKLIYSLCEVCNIQLNSAAQAQVHYNGKSHLKRVKQLNNGEMPPASTSTSAPQLPLSTLTSSCSLSSLNSLNSLSSISSISSTSAMTTGSSCHSSPLPALVRTPSLMMHQSGCTLDMKPFMPFQVDTSSPVGLFPNFNTMDPVQKAVINHTFGVSIPPKKKQVISCNICQLRFNSDSQAEAHYKGSKHAKKLKAQESTKNKPPKSLNAAAAGPDGTKTITTTSTSSNCTTSNNTSSSTTTTSFSSCTAVTASNGCDQPEKHMESPNGGAHINNSSTSCVSPKAFLPLSPLAAAAASGCLSAVALPGFCKPFPAAAALEPTSASFPLTSDVPGGVQHQGPAALMMKTTTMVGATAKLTSVATPAAVTAGGLSATTTAAGALAASNGTVAGATATPTTAGAADPNTESEEEKAKKLLYCSLCKVAVNSLSQLEAHNTGSKHKTMLEARSGAGPIKAYPRPGSKLKAQASAILKGSGLQNKTFHCEICDVHVNSEIQLKQHISSRRHKDRVAGKPLKPKYSPYNKQQRSSSVLAAKLALQKDLVKPTITTAAFLSPNPFSATTVPSISLHARPNAASLFQTAGLPPSFLRAAPGPIRGPTTGSILFAPY
ncbi:zinc finger protein 385B isoform X2 [Engraulis encrasicolus]